MKILEATRLLMEFEVELENFYRRIPPTTTLTQWNKNRALKRRLIKKFAQQITKNNGKRDNYKIP